MNKNLFISAGKNGFRNLTMVCCLLCVFLHSGFGQSLPVDSSIRIAFNQYRGAYIQEKIFAHTDKGLYMTGELCWFRLYYVNALFGKAESFSRIAYVELLDRNNLPVLQEKISLKPGEAAGSMVIPSAIPSGTYRFRAYTSWMKNFDPAYFFEKPLRIINPRELSMDSMVFKKDPFDIQFFPEGGNLVQHIESRIAFRVVDEHGKGLDCTGVLLDSKGDTVKHFETRHMGLGQFYFTPVDGEQYRAVIRFPKGQESVRDLPAVYPAGVVMGLSKNGEGNLVVGVQVSPELADQDLYLFIHGNRTYLPVKKQALNKQSARFLVRPGELEDGISQFTLFDQNGRPACERLYFKFPENKLSITAELNAEYGTRKKIDLSLEARDLKGNPVSADMSMAVYRLDSLQAVDACDIRSYFYLESELGPVENPSFYLDPSAAREEDLENLMMTRGWRRYAWKNGLNAALPSPVFPPEMRGHIIHGKLLGKTGLPTVHMDAYLSVPSTRTQFRTAYSDEQGNLAFEMKDFYGSQELIVQTDPRKDSSLHIEISSPFSQKFSNTVLPDFPLPGKNSRTLLYRSVRGQVQWVYGDALLNRFSAYPVDTNSFYVVPDESYLLDNYTRFLTMEEVLREYVQFASVSKKNDKFQLMLADKPRVNAFHEPPLILIDGVPFFDADELFRQDPKMIRRIELVNRQYALGNKTFEGIVNLTTYQGDLNGIVMNPHATVIDYPGLQEEREFFSPVYETEDEMGSRMPDYRTLLYWAPKIKAGEHIFYSSDLPGKYVIVVQGLSDQGLPGCQVVYFNVVK